MSSCYQDHRFATITPSSDKIRGTLGIRQGPDKEATSYRLYSQPTSEVVQASQR